MNRGQIKRIRKGFDRLRKEGREWDALSLLVKEKAVDEFRAEWDESWRSLARAAFRTAAVMKSFLARLRDFDAPPDYADIRFLEIVGRYLDGRDVTAELSGISGLSAPAETLRGELLRRKVESPAGEEKIRKLLERFAAKPEGITLREYRQLNTLLTAYPSIPATVSDSLGQLLARSRKLNSVTSVKQGVRGVRETDVVAIDHDLKAVASAIPSDLFRVVAAPVLAQISLALGRVAEISPNQGAGLALSIPFIMGMLAGPCWDELRKKFQLETASSMSVSDRASLRKSAQTASFEERLSLVNKLARLMSSQEWLDEDLQDTLVLLYKGVFAELLKRRASLPEREQRRIAAIFGPILADHIPLLCNNIEDLPFLLDAAAAAGCLDASLTLLHTIFALSVRDRTMTANARGMLKLLPAIGEKDVQALFAEHQSILCEDLNLVKRMLDICRECGHELDALVATGLGYSLMSFLIMNSIAGGAGRGRNFLDMFMGDTSEETSRTAKKLVKGIECFADNQYFNFPVEFARAFPSGKLSGAEYRGLMEKLISAGLLAKQIIENIAVLLQMLRVTYKARNEAFPFGGMSGDHTLQREMLTAGLDVLCGKRNLAERHLTDDLFGILELVRCYGNAGGTERYLLIISNVAAERSQQGDAAAGELHATIMGLLAPKNRPPKKRGRQR